MPDGFSQTYDTIKRVANPHVWLPHPMYWVLLESRCEHSMMVKQKQASNSLQCLAAAAAVSAVATATATTRAFSMHGRQS